jgi:hypothetical protein
LTRPAKFNDHPGNEASRSFDLFERGNLIHLDYLLLSLKTDKEVAAGPSEINNYISTEYNRRFPKRGNIEGTLFSQQNAATPVPYFYPRIQYKVIRGGPIIAAINEGCQLLWDLYDKLDELNENETQWKITEKRLIEKKVPFGICSEHIKYRFLTPWLALPEDAFKKYLTMDDDGKQKVLSKSLDTHVRSISESLGCHIDGDFLLKMHIRSNYIYQRDIHMAGIFCSFVANIEIPNFLGIGKSVSRGFGTVKQV